MIKQEWAPEKKWNPFNSDKLLAHIPRWAEIKYQKIPPQPSLITVDPTNVCNLKCSWCNSKKILSERNKELSTNLLMDIPRTLASWKTNKNVPPGVPAICIAGGGEPLLHPDISYFINLCSAHKIEVGIVTNGTKILDHIEALSKCTWVGVSVDAGGPELFRELKGANLFDDIIYGIKTLSEYSTKNNTRLGLPRLGNGVFYKFLLHPSNYLQLETAIEVAHGSGAKGIHIRPSSAPWFDLDHPIAFNYYIRESFNLALERTRRRFEGPNFGIYGITHKFDDDLAPKNHFNRCWALFMTGVLMPGELKNTYTFGLCCDRRGDSNIELVKNCEYLDNIKLKWGLSRHWEIFNEMDVATCPRCTYQPHNRIFEQVILGDSMTWKFI